MTTGQEIKEEVRRRYGEAAKKAQAKDAASCCGDEPIEESAISSTLYATDELQHLPQEAVVASLGCGNPVAVAALREGESVLDLGSGGGIDVLLSARRVGPQGRAYGLDMTDEMLDLARENARKAGVSNVQFLKGEMEAMPLPNAEVDVIISNCVVNLSPDKDAVLREAFRVLKPGGRIAIADIVTHDVLPEAIQESMKAWTGCIAGALTEADYTAKLAAAGFGNIEIESFREYTAEDAEAGVIGDQAKELEGTGSLGIFSGVVRATKPALSPAQAGSEGPGGHQRATRDEALPVVASEDETGRCC
ncbi:MAG TPA: arsenite methyltransferase [Dehalococcoidia bacterium]